MSRPWNRELGWSLVIGWLNVQSLRRKTDVVQQTIAERSLAVVALTETRHNDHYDVCVRLSTPAGYAARRRCAWSYVGPWRRRRCRHLPPASQVLASVAASMPRRENDLGAAHYHWRPGRHYERLPTTIVWSTVIALLQRTDNAAWNARHPLVPGCRWRRFQHTGAGRQQSTSQQPTGVIRHCAACQPCDSPVWQRARSIWLWRLHCRPFTCSRYRPATWHHRWPLTGHVTAAGEDRLAV